MTGVGETYLKGADKNLYCLSHKHLCPLPATYKVYTYTFLDRPICKVCNSFDEDIRLSDKGLVAWRGWSVIIDFINGRLSSISTPTIWEPKEKMIAMCLGIDANMAGIWSVKRESFGMFHGVKGLHNYHFHIIGEVYIWGKIVEHGFGYRSEFAYPKSLYVVRYNYNADYYNKISNKLKPYGVPVSIIDNLEEPWLNMTVEGEQKCK